MKEPTVKQSRRWRIAQFCEIRWWQFYLSDQPVERYLKEKSAYWRRIRDQLEVMPEPAAPILDAGCGPSGMFMVWADHPVTALDPLLDSYDQLPHFSRDWYPHVSFFAEAIETWETTESFPWVFCLNVINHVSDLELALARLSEVTEPGGHLLLTVDVHKHHLLKKVFRALPGDVLHPHQHDRMDYERRLQRAGFCIEQSFCLKQGRIFDYFYFLATKQTI